MGYPKVILFCFRSKLFFRPNAFSVFFLFRLVAVFDQMLVSDRSLPRAKHIINRCPNLTIRAEKKEWTEQQHQQQRQQQWHRQQQRQQQQQVEKNDLWVLHFEKYATETNRSAIFLESLTIATLEGWMQSHGVKLNQQNKLIRQVMNNFIGTLM